MPITIAHPCANEPLWDPDLDAPTAHEWDYSAMLCANCGLPLEVHYRADEERWGNDYWQRTATREDIVAARARWTGPVYAGPHGPAPVREPLTPDWQPITTPTPEDLGRLVEEAQAIPTVYTLTALYRAVCDRSINESPDPAGIGANFRRFVEAMGAGWHDFVIVTMHRNGSPRWSAQRWCSPDCIESLIDERWYERNAESRDGVAYTRYSSSYQAVYPADHPAVREIAETSEGFCSGCSVTLGMGGTGETRHRRCDVCETRFTTTAPLADSGTTICPDCTESARAMESLCYCCGEDHATGEAGECDGAPDDVADLLPVIVAINSASVNTDEQLVLWSTDEVTQVPGQFAFAV